MPAWSRDHSLSSALKASVCWYFQEVARRVGEVRMAKFLKRLNYGNQDTSGGLDKFWLHGGLAISVDEQLEFLRKLYAGKLGTSQPSVDSVKTMLFLQKVGGCRLSGQTGTASLAASRELAWLVGYVECATQVSFFALNMEGDQVWELWGPPTKRRQLVVQLLRAAGVLGI